MGQNINNTLVDHDKERTHYKSYLDTSEGCNQLNCTMKEIQQPPLIYSNIPFDMLAESAEHLGINNSMCILIIHFENSFIVSPCLIL